MTKKTDSITSPIGDSNIIKVTVNTFSITSKDMVLTIVTWNHTEMGISTNSMFKEQKTMQHIRELQTRTELACQLCYHLSTTFFSKSTPASIGIRCCKATHWQEYVNGVLGWLLNHRLITTLIPVSDNLG